MTRLTIMTWNVLYKEKADNILTLIKQIKPDILCCQEITTKSPLNPDRDIPYEVGNIIGNYRYAEVINFIDGRPGSLGNAIFSKFPISSSRSSFVQKGKPKIQEKDYSAQNRVYLEADIQIKTKFIKIGTVHLSYTPGFVETPARTAEASNLYESIKEYNENYVITGDFNAAPNSKIIRKMRKHFKSADPSFDQNTFTTKPFSHGGFSVNGLEWRLDYIFTTPDTKVISSRIIETDFSDHLPVLTEIEI